MANEFELHYALLNTEQQRAVNHIDGPMLVLAGAGTGKTQIIALRIAKLLTTQDLQPRNILCLTFTESGVQAMRERLVKLLGATGYQVRIATFHGFCNEVILEHPEVFFEHGALEQVADLDRIALLQSIIADLPAESPLKPFGAPDFYIPDITRAIQTLKREHVLPERLKELVEIQAKAAQGEPETTADKKRVQSILKQLPKQAELVDVYAQYQAKLKENKQYDYEDMLLFTIAAFKQHPDLLADYQEQFLYMLVDEYQDTNGAQNEILTLLGSHQTDPNLFVVGDDKQSIFRFQGAALENILQFQHTYGKAVQLVSLKENYRSQQYILDAADAVIANNQHSLTAYIPELKTKLHAARDIATSKLAIAKLSTTGAELFWITEQVKGLLKQGVAAKEIAIIFRTNADGLAVFDACVRAGLPVHLSAGSNVLADPLIQQLVRLFSYVGLGGNDDSLFAIAHYNWLKLPLADVAVLSHQANRTHQWLWQAFEASEQPALKTFAANLLRWRGNMHNDLCTQWFTNVVKESGWLEYALKTEHGLEHLNRLNTLYHAVQQLTRSNPNTTIKDVLEYLQLLQQHNLLLEEEPLQTHAEAVRLTTAHRAKGLEFAHVFIMKATDKHWGNVPDRSKLKLPEGILAMQPEGVDTDKATERNEDERRLFYVAMTRAKEKLYISYPTQSDTGKAVLPSQFIAELPVDLLEDAEGVEQVESEPLERLQEAGTPPTETISFESVKTYAQGLLENYRMSATHLNDYLECPRIFFYQDLLRVPRPTTRAVGFGVAIHNALKFASDTFNRTKKLPTVNQVIAEFKSNLDKQLLTKADYKDSLAFGQTTLKEYWTANKQFLTLNSFPEKDFKPLNVMVSEVPLTGKVDAIQVLDEAAKTVHVADYKTGNPDNKASNLAVGGSYHRQLVFYKLLVDNAVGFDYTAKSGEIHFVQPSKAKGKHVSRSYEYTEEDVTTTTQEIVEVYQHIQNLDFLNPAPEALCGECDYCVMFNPHS